MLKITINKIEKIAGRKVIKNLKVIGFDTASRTGWCKIVTDNTHVHLDYGFIDIKSKNLYFKYDQCIEAFDNLVFNELDKVVIEETWYGRNVRVFQLLSRLGGFIYALAHLKKIKQKYFLSAVQARKTLGFTSRGDKKLVHKEFHEKFKDIKIEDNDIVDGIILALCGILEEPKLDV